MFKKKVIEVKKKVLPTRKKAPVPKAIKEVPAVEVPKVFEPVAPSGVNCSRCGSLMRLQRVTDNAKEYHCDFCGKNLNTNV